MTKKTEAVKKPVRKSRTAATASAIKKSCTAPKKVRVVLTVQAELGSTVYLAGSFNNWDPTDIKMVDKDSTGVYTVSVSLLPGIYEYKFVINGVWTIDPDPDRDWTQNGLGTLNSVLRVG